MTDIQLVKESLKLLAGFNDEETEKYMPVLNAAVASVSAMLKDDADENDPRVIQLAAAKAYCAICRSASESGGITSFSAGDVSLTMKDSAADDSKAYLAAALADCEELIKDSGFAFLSI